MKFSASFDWLVKLITAVVLLLVPFLTVKIIQQWDARQLGKTSLMLSVLGLGLLTLALLIAYLLHPKAYWVSHKKFIILRPLLDIKIPVTEITEARVLTEEERKGSTLRIFGSGGFFGYFGRFWNSKLGWLTYYATQRRNYILVSTVSGKRYIITPDDLSFEGAMRAELQNIRMKEFPI